MTELDQFWVAVRKLVEGGHRVGVFPCLSASFYACMAARPFHAVLQYRAAVDEATAYAQGFSYDLEIAALLGDEEGVKAFEEIIAKVEREEFND